MFRLGELRTLESMYRRKLESDQNKEAVLLIFLVMTNLTALKVKAGLL